MGPAGRPGGVPDGARRRRGTCSRECPVSPRAGGRGRACARGDRGVVPEGWGRGRLAGCVGVGSFGGEQYAKVVQVL